MTSTVTTSDQTAAPDIVMGGTVVLDSRPITARRRVGDRTVIGASLLAILVIIPGLLLLAGLRADPSSLHGRVLAWLADNLADIRFGSGLRFWLGVTGTTMMALMLLYPVRKAAARGRFLGRIGGWFHVHILLGIFGPVSILYHCNFGHGGANANVALWAMLTVAVSGIVGHFVYTRASADFYADKLLARRRLDSVAATLGGLEAMYPQRTRLIADIESFDAGLLTPRVGILASVKSWLQVERRRRQLLADAGWVIAECKRQQNLSDDAFADLHARLGADLKAYFAAARRASRRSLREQVWARWRLFHLPVFLIMVVAIALHVWAVWGLDDPADAAAGGVTRTAAEGQIKQIRRPTIDIVAVRPEKTAAGNAGADKRVVITSRPVTTKGEASGAVSAPPPTPPPRAASPATTPGKAPRGIADLLATDESEKARATTTGSTRPTSAGGPVVVPPIRPAPPAVAKATPSPSTVPPPEVRPPLVVAERPVPPPAAVAPSPPPPVPVKPAPAAPADPVRDLERAIESPPMALGRPRGLAEQIIELKARMARREFSHSDGETGFALTGRHKRVDCAGCHKAPLKEVRAASPRQCIDCHRQDDVHRGRRPDCARCHTTNRWSEIIRRR